MELGLIGNVDAHASGTKLRVALLTLTSCREMSIWVALDIANPIDPIDLSIRILNQVVAMERDEALRRPRWCGRSKSRDLL